METEIKAAQRAAGISHLQAILDNNTPTDDKTLQRCYMLRDFGALMAPRKSYNDPWGIKTWTRYEIQPGRPRSVEFTARFWRDAELVASMKSWLENTNL